MLSGLLIQTTFKLKKKIIHSSTNMNEYICIVISPHNKRLRMCLREHNYSKLEEN